MQSSRGDDPGLLAAFFHPDRWRSSLEGFEKSGYALVDEILALRPRFVIDVGCGYNEFKSVIPNLLGIDLVNEKADLVCDFRGAPIRAESIDVALALGSINFGAEEDILTNLRVVAEWLRPGGVLFMRGNTGEEIGAGIPLFPWSPAAVVSLGRRAGLELDGEIEEEAIDHLTYGRSHRLVWRYVKADDTSAP